MTHPHERLSDGLLAFPLTPFTESLDIDLDVFAQVVDTHVTAGAGAVFVACGTGEFSSLSPAEHISLLGGAREAAGGRAPVWIGAGGGAATARAAVAAAEEGGADGVLLLPPYLVTGPQEGLVNYVRHAIGNTRIPVIVYHRATAVFTERAVLELLTLPSVVGLKDGYGDVELMSRIVTTVRTADTPRARDFLFFNGLPTAEITARAYAAIGVPHYSSAVHCFVPEVAQRFHRALAAGEAEVMDTLLARFYLPLVALRDETPGFAVSLVKAAARLRGMKVGTVRPPLGEPDRDQLRRLERIIADGGAALREVGA